MDTSLMHRRESATTPSGTRPATLVVVCDSPRSAVVFVGASARELRRRSGEFEHVDVVWPHRREVRSIYRRRHERQLTRVLEQPQRRSSLSSAPGQLLEAEEAFFKIQCRVDVEGHAEFDNREGDRRMNSHNDRGGASKSGHLCEIAKRGRRERVENIERGNVDDHALGAASADLFDQFFLEFDQLSIVERRMNRGDEKVSLFEDRDEHRRDRVLACFRTAYPEAEQPLCLLDATLKIADGVHLGQIHADGHERAGDVGRESGDDDAGAHEA